MLTTVAVYVEDEPGVLNRVASLFRRRGFNIASLTVGHTERPGLSRMTIVVDTDESGSRRIEANLRKLLNVARVEVVPPGASVMRDLALIKVAATPASRPDIMQLVDVFRARVVDMAPDAVVIETTGTEDKVDSLLDMLRPYGVIEMVRTGRIAMARSVQLAVGTPRLDAAATAADETICSV